MIGQSQFRVILYSAAIVSAAFFFLGWLIIPNSAPQIGEQTDSVKQGLLLLYKWFSLLISVATSILVVFDRFAWRWPLVCLLTKNTPDIQGTWKGEIISTWVNPETNERVAPIQAYLVARQTWSTLSLRLYTEESQSKLITGGFVPDADSTCTVSGIYQNIPDLLKRDSSSIHHGAFLLQICGTGPHTLSGQYWTDRKTIGEMHFLAKSPKKHFSFETATKDDYKEVLE